MELDYFKIAKQAVHSQFSWDTLGILVLFIMEAVITVLSLSVFLNGRDSC